MATYGGGKFKYESIDEWAKLPKGWQFGILVAVAVDSQERVYVCHQREDPPILVFDRNGDYLTSWGAGEINEAHIMYIDANDVIYLVDRGAHTVLKLSAQGKKLLEIGRRGHASYTGVTAFGAMPKKAAGPFNMPTRMMPSPGGDLYVSDGYRNSRVHKFSDKGSLIMSWGAAGKKEPGEFHLPHSLWVDKQGKVYVCDRKNNRVQVFTGDGEFIDQWPNLSGVTDIFMDANETVYVHGNGNTGPDSWTAVMDKKGKTLERWDSPQGHQIWADRRGDIYLAVTWQQRVMKMVKKS
ncbi:MAG: hypothetical protein FJ320_09320 [SAR202 cluster bacterium]|nr:hypothetical protein [SAR202 cluster bacterium]